MLGRIKNRRVRIIRRVFLAALAVCAVWYLISRIRWIVDPVDVATLDVAAPTTQPFTGRLRIGAYNIAHGRGTARNNHAIRSRREVLDRMARIADIIKAEGLDVVVLNEVDFKSYWSRNVDEGRVIAERAGFAHYARQTNIDVAIPFVSIRSGNAVLSRYPIEKAELVSFPGYRTWQTVLAGTHRGLLCTLRLPDGRRIRVAAVHLAYRGKDTPTRIASARIIERLCRESPLPMFAAGDFNSTLPGWPRAMADARGRTAMSVLLESGHWRTLPTTQPAPADLTFSSIRPMSVIDWILAPANSSILSKKVLRLPLSDHNLVAMEVQVGGP